MRQGAWQHRPSRLPNTPMGMSAIKNRGRHHATSGGMAIRVPESQAARPPVPTEAPSSHTLPSSLPSSAAPAPVHQLSSPHDNLCLSTAPLLSHHTPRHSLRFLMHSLPTPHTATPPGRLIPHHACPAPPPPPSPSASQHLNQAHDCLARLTLKSPWHTGPNQKCTSVVLWCRAIAAGVRWFPAG